MKMPNMKFEIKKIDGKNSFSSWQFKVCTILIQQGLWKTLEERDKKLTSIIEEDWEDMEL